MTHRQIVEALRYVQSHGRAPSERAGLFLFGLRFIAGNETDAAGVVLTPSGRELLERSLRVLDAGEAVH